MECMTKNATVTQRKTFKQWAHMLFVARRNVAVRFESALSFAGRAACGVPRNLAAQKCTRYVVFCYSAIRMIVIGVGPVSSVATALRYDANARRSAAIVVLRGSERYGQGS